MPAADQGEAWDHQVDFLVVGSGGGGLTAALTADAHGLDTLIIEKAGAGGNPVSEKHPDRTARPETRKAWPVRASRRSTSTRS
jgi:flavin-dependent dehydrogenase